MTTLTFFCSARPPAILHVCKESREVGLKYFKPFFAKRQGSATISRPIYVRPRFDVLYLEFVEYSTLAKFPEAYPEANEFESIAIYGSIGHVVELFSSSARRRFSSMKRLFIVTSRPPCPPLWCCTAVKLLPHAAGDKLKREWTGAIDCLRFCPSFVFLDVDTVEKRHSDLANIQAEVVVAESIRHNCY
jgi:hypothetical protein